MPPPSNLPSFSLRVLEGHYVVQQLGVTSPELPALVMRISENPFNGGLMSITRTDEELSIVRPSSPDEIIDGAQLWRCIKVKGPMEFGLLLYSK